MMMVISALCSAFAAVVLLAAAAGIYFVGRDKPAEERNQPIMIGVAALGVLAGLIAIAIVGIFVTRFMLVSF